LASEEVRRTLKAGKNVDTVSPELRSAIMSRIHGRDTLPEMIVRSLVHGMGYRYRLHVAKLPGKPDLVFPRLKCVIEVRGCFWHQHRGCGRSGIPASRREFWAPKLERNQRRDEENMRKLRALGWRPCVVWECETKGTWKLFKRLARFLGTKGR
jgi:DNA mismatch endonuclease (patch repair protein)